MADFTLQLLHASDQEGGIPALEDAPNFSAVLNALKNEDADNNGIPDYLNTLVLSSGDAYIPGAFFAASEDVFGGPGRGDILIQNELGFQAISFGNHEFDQGTGTVADLITGDETFPGTAFPYLSGNIDFSPDENLAGLVVDPAGAPQGNSITSSVVIDVNGEPIGVVGATVPTLNTISSPGDVILSPSGFNANDEADLDALAAVIQEDVDALLAANPDINKVVLLSHMQQLAVEQALATRLSDVDIIIGGGSNTLSADETDRLRAGDTVQGDYPIFSTDIDGNPIAVVNTDGNYKYVGRLVVHFDENGFIVPSSYDSAVSGAYATDAQGVADLGAEALIDPEIQDIVDALEVQISDQDGDLYGSSDVFLNGTREDVRTQETNLGNLSADANLAVAKEYDPTVVVSLKNGGGIRDNIGIVTYPPGSTNPEDLLKLPTEANPLADKEEGDISQLDISNSLRFNNELTLLTVDALELKQILEHAVAATEEGATPGQFAQVGGLQFSFDASQQAIEFTRDTDENATGIATDGERIQSLVVLDDNGEVADIVVENGELVGDSSRTFRIVTLNFLADGGDGYPYPLFGEDRVDLVEQTPPATNLVTFAEDGTEQDALAEYLAENFPVDDDPATPIFSAVDTPPAEDTRIQNLSVQEDSVIPATLLPDPVDSVFLDVRDITGSVATEFTLNREAAYENFVGFYAVVDEAGGIDTDGDGTADVLPGDGGYTDAALTNRVADIGLVTANLQTSVFQSNLAGGALYAPFIIADGNPSSFDRDEVYFAFTAANSDGVEHIRFANDALLFEDLAGGGDNDFNDAVINVQFA